MKIEIQANKKRAKTLRRTTSHIANGRFSLLH